MTRNPSAAPRVLLIHNFLTPYRVPLFTELSGRFDLDVWILGDVRKIREWTGNPDDMPFRCRALPNISVPTGSRDYRILVNHTLPSALRRHEHDVLLCCGWDTPAVFYAALTARRRMTPFVLWSGSTHAEPNWRRSISRPLVRKVVRQANAWIAYGTRAKEYLVSLGADADRTVCAFNAVEASAFDEVRRYAEPERSALKQNLGIPSHCRVVLYCGQLIDRKGLPDLIPAFAAFSASHPDTRLVVVGSGPQETAYRKLADTRGVRDRVHFEGFVGRSDLPRFYGMADLFVLPSREEVWGLVINEALTCGVPVVTTDACGASVDLVQEGVNGYVVPSGGVDALGAALSTFFDDVPAGSMRDDASNSIRPFSIPHAADAFEDAVRCAMDRP